MKNLLCFITCIFCFSFLLSCSEMDNPVTQAAKTDESLFPLEENIPLSAYPDGWIKLTDEDVKELMNLEIPPNWHNMNISQEWKDKYNHVTLLRQFGDIPEVRYIVEFERNPGFNISRELFVAYFEAHYRLFPNENNRRALEDARNIENQPRPDPPPRITREEPLTIERAEEIRAKLIEKHGDIPLVRLVANLTLKAAQGQPITDDEYLAYLEAKHLLEPQNENIRRRLEKYRKAKAQGIPFHLVEHMNDDE